MIFVNIIDIIIKSTNILSKPEHSIVLPQCSSFLNAIQENRLLPPGNS